MPVPKLLLISYQFPPAGGVPVQRIMSLARYFPKYGHEVHVLCCRNPGIPTMDPGLLQRVPPQVRVWRTWSPEPPYALRKKIWSLITRPKSSPGTTGTAPPTKPAAGRGASLGDLLRRIFFPDPEVVWAPFALRTARKVIRRYGIEGVVVSAPPFSAYQVGTRLKKEFPHIKLIADCRDDWLGYYVQEYDFYKSETLRSRAAALERELVESSSLVVCVTRTIAGEMRARYPELPDARFAHVPNGYDPEAFAGFRPRPHGTAKIVVTYTGTLHKSSSARYYLDALDALPEEFRARFETRFIGRIPEEEAQHLRNRKTAIRQFGFLPQAEAFRWIEETDYLLVTMMHAGSMTGKVFEYLATGKPILAIGPHGSEIERVIQETGAGWCAAPSEPDEVRAMLQRAAEAGGSAGAAFQPNWEAIQRFDRSRIAGEYSRLIQAAVS